MVFYSVLRTVSHTLLKAHERTLELREFRGDGMIPLNAV